MTEKLFWTDPHATSFETTGARLATFEDRPTVVLPRTLFYPEGGGQLGDSGMLAVGTTLLRVADTRTDASGVIHHVLAEPAPEDVRDHVERSRPEDLVVRGVIDEARRRDHMAQHTGQHAFSRALLDRARAETVSARLGATTCTIDVDKAHLTDAELHRAEDAVNEVIMADVPIRSFFPTADELARLALRKAPDATKSKAGVRVVSIEGYDTTPCGGTHCTRTGQVGQVRLVATERYKGMTRVTFHAGARALADARARSAVLAAIANELTCSAADVPAAVAKLRAEVKSTRDKLDAARAELAELVALRLRATLPDTPGPHVVALVRDTDDLASLRMLAGTLAGDARVVAICAAHDGSTGDVMVIVQRGSDAVLDCGAFVLAQARARKGRGGGRPERAEARFPRGTSVEVLAEAARAAILG